MWWPWNWTLIVVTAHWAIWRMYRFRKIERRIKN